MALAETAAMAVAEGWWADERLRAGRARDLIPFIDIFQEWAMADYTSRIKCDQTKLLVLGKKSEGHNRDNFWRYAVLLCCCAVWKQREHRNSNGNGSSSKNVLMREYGCVRFESCPSVRLITSLAGKCSRIMYRTPTHSCTWIITTLCVLTTLVNAKCHAISDASPTDYTYILISILYLSIHYYIRILYY